MKNSREFEIAWQGLKLGVHNYTYTLDDAFMQGRSAPAEFFDWKAQVTLRFDKHESFFMLHLDVGGTVNTPCDRCGDDFELKLWDEFDLLVKLSGEDDDRGEEEDADVVFIPRHETVIDISDWLYEFTMLAVPLQRIHPDRADGTPGCNSEALRLLGDLAGKEAEENSDEPTGDVQPAASIWKGLQNITIAEDGDAPKSSKKSAKK